MTKPDQNTAPIDPITSLLEHGLGDALPRIAEMLMNAAMYLERSAHLRAQPHQRTEARNGYANGFKRNHMGNPIWRYAWEGQRVRG